jgi:hypothetical protein
MRLLTPTDSDSGTLSRTAQVSGCSAAGDRHSSRVLDHAVMAVSIFSVQYTFWTLYFAGLYALNLSEINELRQLHCHVLVLRDKTTHISGD